MVPHVVLPHCQSLSPEDDSRSPLTQACGGQAPEILGLDLMRLAVVRLQLKPPTFDGEANARLQAEGTHELRAVICTKYGPPEVLRLEERETPAPRRNEVRIRILATAVTSSDCYVRGLNLSLAYQLMARLALGWNAPRQPVLGMLLSGEVDSVGPDAKSFEVGQPVFGFNQHRFGTYAQYVCLP